MEQEVCIFDISAYGQLGERVKEKSHQGQGVRVVRWLKQERWNDNNGKECAKVIVVADHIEFKVETKPNDTEPQNIRKNIV